MSGCNMRSYPASEGMTLRTTRIESLGGPNSGEDVARRPSRDDKLPNTSPHSVVPPAPGIRSGHRGARAQAGDAAPRFVGNPRSNK